MTREDIAENIKEMLVSETSMAYLAEIPEKHLQQLYTDMQAYMQRKQEEEQSMLQSTQEQRRQAFSYEQALGHLAKGVCPSCERPLSTSEPNGLADYCVHCGLCAYKNCTRCNTLRRNSISGRIMPANNVAFSAARTA